MSTKKKIGIRKSFRLFDFNVYDEDQALAKESFDSDDSGDDKYNSFKDEKNFIIQMFGVNEKGETCCLYVEDYKPFFFVRVGDDWSEYNKRSFVDELKKKIGKTFQDSIVSSHLVDHHKLYGFSGGIKHKFIKLVFKNTVSMNKTKNLWFSYVTHERTG